MTTLADIFPLLAGRTGIETITRKVPVIFRFYGSIGGKVTIRKKVSARRSGGKLWIGTKPITFQLPKRLRVINRITISLDFPLLDDLEAEVGAEPFPVTDTTTLSPDKAVGALLEVG